MIFTLDNLINSIAGVLKSKYPDYPVYASPNQQGTDFPCFFIFFMPSKVDGQVGGYSMRDLGVDIVFVQQRNIADGNAEIHAIADYLDGVMGLFPYSDGGNEKAMARTSERQWKVEDGELHYQFHIKKRVALPRGFTKMAGMEGNAHAK